MSSPTTLTSNCRQKDVGIDTEVSNSLGLTPWTVFGTVFQDTSDHQNAIFRPDVLV